MVLTIKWTGLALLLLTTAAMAAPASKTAEQVAGQDQVVTATLKNGMTIVVWPDHKIPNVALYNFVRVGSRNEVTGRTGLAHFFEHMMFNGTTTQAQGGFDRVMESQGGDSNAMTSEDVTIYQDWFPRTSLLNIFTAEADRLQNLAFVPDVVERERNVVYSERRLRVEDDNARYLQEQVQATAFLAHSYGTPVLGWPTDIESWTLDDLKQFYSSYYLPNNCTVVIVGDVDAAQVIALARQYFEPITARALPPPLHTQEPEQRGERRLVLNVPAQAPLLQFAYHGVAATDADLPALEMLLRALAYDDSSRLQQALVETHPYATNVSGDVTPSFDPGLVWFTLTLPPGGDIGATQTAFDAEIQRVMTNGITRQEIAKARNILLSEYWQQLSTIDGKAAALGHYAVFNGDYRMLFGAPQRYAQVTAAQIQRVAQRLLQPGNRTVGVLIPQALTENTKVEHK